MGNLFYEKKRGRGLLLALVITVFSLAIFMRTRLKKGNSKFGLLMGVDKNERGLGNLPRWNLNDLYLGTGDADLEKDFLWVEKNSYEFIKKYIKTLKKLSGYELYRAIGEYEKIREMLAKIESFSSMKYLEDTSVEGNMVFFSRNRERIARLLAELAFFENEINGLGDAEMARKLSDSSNLREHYDMFLENLRLLRGHQLSYELERFLVDRESIDANLLAFGKIGYQAGLFENIIAKTKFRFEGKNLNLRQIADIARNNGEENRRVKAAKLYSRGLEENIELFAHIMNMSVKEKIVSDEWRKFDKPISHANLLDGIDDTTAESLYDTVQRNYGPVVHRYYTLKAKMMGKNKLLYTDLNAPAKLSGRTRKYSWQEATSMVLSAQERFSPEVAEICREFFDNSWTNVNTGSGKPGKTFCFPTIPQVHPYLLLNFQGKDKDIMILAHELGCGLGAHLSKGNGYLTFRTPAILVEAISIFSENLVFDYLRENETNIDRKIAMISKRIEDLIENISIEATIMEFENTIYEERKQGELIPARIDEIWISVWKKALGDVFKLDNEYRYHWAGISQLFTHPFRSCSHIFAGSLANILYSRYKKNSENFKESYIKLLSSGSNVRYSDLLVSLGVDLGDENFWQEGLNVIVELIDELEILLKISSLL
ncbi:MAG: M3 family metallopeptidase [Rickettsiales bacterium]|jgi:oligoendopeptidase F|nr:M3 family metallopeptidase [Rickettsiales bacterium]